MSSRCSSQEASTMHNACNLPWPTLYLPFLGGGGREGFGVTCITLCHHPKLMTSSDQVLQVLSHMLLYVAHTLLIADHD